MEVDLVGAVERDVFDQQAGDAFALSLRGRGIGPEGGEVGGELTDPGLVLLGELGVRCGGGVFVVVLGGLELAELVVPVGFEGVGDEPVVGVDRRGSGGVRVRRDGGRAGRGWRVAGRLHRRVLRARLGR